MANYLTPDSVHAPPSAQDHISLGNKINLGNYSEHRVEASSIPTGFPDVYTNLDVTVQIDPMNKGHNMWIRDDAGRAAAAQSRGALKDHDAVMQTVALVNAKPDCPETFVPTSNMLDSSLKYSAKCISSSTRGREGKLTGKGELKGQLPTISRMIWENRLMDKPDWLVESDVWAEHRFDRNRAFDCRGTCR